VAQDEIRLLLDEELARETPPPLGYLVDASMRRGKRMRRTRMSWAVGGTALAGLALGALIAGTTALPRPGLAGGPQAAAGGTSSSSVAAAATTTVNATNQGMLELLSHLLPQGRRSEPAVPTSGGLMVAMNLDRGQGVGMVRVRLVSGLMPVPSSNGCPKTWTCRTLPDGNVVMILSLPDNCIQHQYVLVRRPDHVGVEVTSASCLSWNGRTNPPGKVVLSVDEAVAIGDNPQWGLQMSKDLVDAGQRDFPHPGTFG
jgi:hypothetical protein